MIMKYNDYEGWLDGDDYIVAQKCDDTSLYNGYEWGNKHSYYNYEDVKIYSDPYLKNLVKEFKKSTSVNSVERIYITFNSKRTAIYTKIDDVEGWMDLTEVRRRDGEEIYRFVSASEIDTNLIILDDNIEFCKDMFSIGELNKNSIIKSYDYRFFYGENGYDDNYIYVKGDNFEGYLTREEFEKLKQNQYVYSNNSIETEINDMETDSSDYKKENNLQNNIPKNKIRINYKTSIILCIIIALTIGIITLEVLIIINRKNKKKEQKNESIKDEEKK